MMGGIGCCGRPLCCSTFLGDFEPVSIRMAKDQKLSLNPTKISGICGRLMCCLKYENDSYAPCCKKIPAPVVGREVITIDGEGKVTFVNQGKKNATILLANGNTVIIPWEEVVEKDING
jgi:cell fate regulator YaaT (PSP1 superfamily)